MQDLILSVYAPHPTALYYLVQFPQYWLIANQGIFPRPLWWCQNLKLGTFAGKVGTPPLSKDPTPRISSHSDKKISIWGSCKKWLCHLATASLKKNSLRALHKEAFYVRVFRAFEEVNTYFKRQCDLLTGILSRLALENWPLFLIAFKQCVLFIVVFSISLFIFASATESYQMLLGSPQLWPISMWQNFAIWVPQLFSHPSDQQPAQPWLERTPSFPPHLTIKKLLNSSDSPLY